MTQIYWFRHAHNTSMDMIRYLRLIGKLINKNQNV